MPITRFLTDQPAFNPDDIRVMSQALEDACNALHVSGDAKAREAIAIRIIELARRGERSPAKLRDRVVQEANGATALYNIAELASKFTVRSNTLRRQTVIERMGRLLFFGPGAGVALGQTVG